MAPCPIDRLFARELPPCPAAALALRLFRRRGFFWLDGECGALADGREGGMSFLGCDPVEVRHATLADPRPLASFPPPSARSDPAEAPSALPGAPAPGRVPRWVGYLAYDAHLAGAARRLTRPAARRTLSFARYPAVLALDHHSARVFAVGDDEAAVAALVERLRAAPPPPAAKVGAVQAPPREQHRVALRRAFEHIVAGDIYQVNLARRFRASLDGDPLALWLALRRESPVPLGFYFDERGAAAGACVMARTMERFLRFDRASRRLWTRPIKGTIARAGDADAAEAARLRADPKERAEHSMIVDLMRNDLGRVAELGSVRVREVMRVEPYARLSHLVSTVECRVRGDVEAPAILAATFPPGSVTGAPKLRAMQVIEALEAAPRDVYTGAVGFVDRHGGLSLAVAIRTAVVRGGEVCYWAGGGIVEASDIEAEVAETELKARVFLDAAARLTGEVSTVQLSGEPSALVSRARPFNCRT